MKPSTQIHKPSAGELAVIFDMDGCLVDSESLCLEVIATEMRHLGISNASAEMVGDRFLGVGITEIGKFVVSKVGGDYPVEFATRVEDRLREKYKSELNVIDGVIGLMDLLVARDIPFSIATGASSERMSFTLQISKLESYFDKTAFCVDDVKQGKPAPDLFLHAARRLGVSPANCLVLEDSPHGIKGACAAGMTAVGFVAGSHLATKQVSHSIVLKEAGAEEVVHKINNFSSYIETKLMQKNIEKIGP